MMMVSIQLVGGPTAVLDVGGLRLVTDPTFDSPGSYPVPDGPTLTKLAAPALTAAEIGRPDAVLLSHDQHADNLDRAGTPAGRSPGPPPPRPGRQGGPGRGSPPAAGPPGSRRPGRGPAASRYR